MRKIHRIVWIFKLRLPPAAARILLVVDTNPGSLLKKLLRDPIAASRARSLLAYLFDMSRRSLRGSLHSGRSLRLFSIDCQTYLFLNTSVPDRRATPTCPLPMGAVGALRFVLVRSTIGKERDRLSGAIRTDDGSLQHSVDTDCTTDRESSFISLRG